MERYSIFVVSDVDSARKIFEFVAIVRSELRAGSSS